MFDMGGGGGPHNIVYNVPSFRGALKVFITDKGAQFTKTGVIFVEQITVKSTIIEI